MILFRCDGNEAIGFGHFFRSLSLAIAAKEAGEKVAIVTKQSSPIVEHYTSIYGIDVWENQLITRDLSIDQVSWVVVDGYHILGHETRRLACEFQVLVIDDLAAEPIDADILLNTNFSSENLDYQLGAATTALFGPRFALLRPEFTQRYTRPTNPRLFVCLGGGDNSEPLQDLLESLPDWPITLVPGLSKITVSNDNIEVNTNPSNMASLMSQCTHAIVGAGSIVWECLAMGLQVAVVKLVDNQSIVAQELSSQNLVVWLNPCVVIETNLIDSFLSDSHYSKPPTDEWRDGLGAQRVLEHIRNHTEALSIRLATIDDARPVWVINNDPIARQNAVNHTPIPYEDHLKWFHDSLQSQTRFLWVLSEKEHIQGVVRADIEAEDARISIAVAPVQRGQGVGAKILSQTIRRLEIMGSIRSISAIIRPENEASIRLFERAAFDCQADKDITINGERFVFYERALD